MNGNAKQIVFSRYTDLFEWSASADIFIYWKTSKSQEETSDEFYSAVLVCLIKTKKSIFPLLVFPQ